MPSRPPRPSARRATRRDPARRARRVSARSNRGGCSSAGALGNVQRLDALPDRARILFVNRTVFAKQPPKVLDGDPRRRHWRDLRDGLSCALDNVHRALLADAVDQRAEVLGCLRRGHAAVLAGRRFFHTRAPSLTYYTYFSPRYAGPDSIVPVVGPRNGPGARAPDDARGPCTLLHRRSRRRSPAPRPGTRPPAVRYSACLTDRGPALDRGRL